jgi:hypothetical protein
VQLHSSAWKDRQGSLCAGAGYDRFYKAVGGVWCTRWGMVLVIPTALLVPLATLFAHNKVAVMVQLFLAMAVNSVADTSAYSGSNVIVRSSILWCYKTVCQAACCLRASSSHA